MKTAEEWKCERWECEDYIVTGYGNTHLGTLTKREAEQIVRFLRVATPLIQADALSHGRELGMREAAEIADLGSRTVMKGDSPEKSCVAVKFAILTAINKERK